MTSIDELRQMVQHFGRPSQVLTESEDRDLRCVGSAILTFCRRKWNELVEHAAQRSQPIFSAYASDGWGRTVQHSVQAKLGKTFVRRVCKTRAEFNLERQVLKIFHDDAIVQAMAFHPPREMLLGKSGWNLFQCAIEDAEHSTIEDAEHLTIQDVAFCGPFCVPFGMKEDGHVFAGRLHVPIHHREAADGRHRPAELVDQIQNMLPWLSQEEIILHLEDPAHRPANPADNGAQRPAPLIVPLVDLSDEVARAVEEIRRRVEVEDEENLSFANFYCKVLWGRWTAAHRGVPYDRIAALPRRHTRHFRRHFGIPTMHSFALSEYAGEENAHQLAKGWVKNSIIISRFGRIKDNRLQNLPLPSMMVSRRINHGLIGPAALTLMLTRPPLGNA